MSTLPSPRTFPTPTVGTASVQVLPVNVTRASLFVFNPNTVAILAISPLDITPVLNQTGTITIPAGIGLTLAGWTNGINAIADTPGSKISIFEFYR